MTAETKSNSDSSLYEGLLSKYGKIKNAEVLSQIGNLSLSNNYLTIVSPPPGLEGKIDIQLPLLCSSASLPGSTFATSEVKDNYVGITQEFAHTRLYTDIDFTYYVDSEYRTLRFFEDWMNYVSGGKPFDTLLKDYAFQIGDVSGAEEAIREIAQIDDNAAGVSPISGNLYRRFNYPKNYKSYVEIIKFEKDFNVKSKRYLTYKFVNAFPKSLSATPVSYGPSELLQVTVTMNYDRYDSYVNYLGSAQSSKPTSPEETPPPPGTRLVPISTGAGAGQGIQYIPEGMTYAEALSQGKVYNSPYALQ